MNVETLHKLAKDLVTENKVLQITGHFQNIVGTLQNMVNQPNQGQHQINLNTYLQQFYTSLSKSLVNDLSPAWYQLLVELSIDNIFGEKLSINVKNILEKNTITPASAQAELEVLFQKLNTTIAGFTNVTNGLSSLNIGTDELEEGDCEVGILIPRNYIDNNLENLGQEIKEITFILNNFSEFFYGEKTSFELKTLSTTDPLITVGTVTVIAAGIAKTVGFLIDNYKKLLEIKKLKHELKNQGLSETELQGIEDHSNNYMSKKIEELIDELEKTYNTINDKGRKKEILNGMRISLNKIANRIDNGFNFEVRVYIKHENTEEQEDELLQEIKAASKSLQFLKIEGEPILSLPESTK